MKEYPLKYNNLTTRIISEYAKVCDGKVKTNPRCVRNFIKQNTIKIDTFHNLVMEIGELSYKNPSVMLLYRGQNKNHIKEKNTALYPSIYRMHNKDDIKNGFNRLNLYENKLLELLENNENVNPEEFDEIKYIDALRHSILQHYEVCATPFLDVTQSIKVACSFAILNNKKTTGYIYVLALPYITGRISENSEEHIKNVRLLSIGCSLSKRPFFQEGYLVRTAYVNSDYTKKGEMDFNRRLVAIYEFNNDSKFWGDENPIHEDNLYPKDDKMIDICKKIIE